MFSWSTLMTALFKCLARKEGIYEKERYYSDRNNTID